MISQHVQPPPKLLLGAAILFWGAMSGNSLLALILAMIVESPNWIRSRWNFNETAYARAWHLSLVLTIASALLIWMDGERITTMERLLSWLPVLLFPLQFVQSFGFHNYLHLNTFQLFSQIYRNTYEKLGIPQTIVRFNFGNIYFLAIITASSLSPNAQQPIYFIGLTILSAWLIFANVRRRIWSIALILTLATVIGFSGQIGLSELYRWATNRGLDFSGIASVDPTTKMTNIGSLGAIKQSPEMRWRVTPKGDQMPPRLLRTASYNRYKGVNWKIIYPDININEDANFRELDSIDLSQGDAYYLLRENMTRQDITKPLLEFELRGASSTGDPLPIPGNTSTLQNFILDGVDINPVGTVRVFPKKAIIQGDVRWNDEMTTEAPPFPKEDLAIDEHEYAGIHEVADSLGLRELATTAQKVQRIKKFFDTEFEYTRYLTIPRAYATQKRPTAIEIFLTSNRAGHCEYFATAATLLLRAAGVPARYTIGFAVMEKDDDENEWIIRGTHAHAWTRVWSQELQRWVDFDPTPSAWILNETQGQSNLRALYDSYQKLKEDFFLWRNEESNRFKVTIVIWIFGILILIYIMLRLRKSRVIMRRKQVAQRLYGSGVRTPLHDLEQLATRILGIRQPGETFVNWLTRLNIHPSLKSKLHEACSIHQQLRFDPDPVADEISSHHLNSITQEIMQELKKMKIRVP